MVFRRLDSLIRPAVSAPRAAEAEAPEAPPPPEPPPAVDAAETAAVNVQTGRTSSFEAFKPPLVNIDRQPLPSEGRRNGNGTADDSLGCGGPSQGRNRGTPDDSIGVGDESVGRNRGTPDDSIGGLGPTSGRANEPDLGVGIGVAYLPAQATAGLPEDTVAKMGALMTPPTTRQAIEASYVFEQPGFQSMSAADREKVVDVMSTGGDRACRAMAELFKQSGGAVLSRVGMNGTRLIDSLDKLATAVASDPAKKSILNDTMYDIANPGRIWQGQAPTCTVSTMQYELAAQQPAEYARLMAGLVADGSVTMRGGGKLEVNAQAAVEASRANNDRRSSSEAIFQSAAMEYANGADTYNLAAQESRGGDRHYRGLYPDQIRTMVGELFGVEYETREIANDAQATNELNLIMGREKPNRPVLFDIDMGDFNHCVALDKIEGNYVYFRDPYTGKEASMTKAEFRERLVAVHYALPPERDVEFAGGKYGGRFGGGKMMIF